MARKVYQTLGSSTSFVYLIATEDRAAAKIGKARRPKVRLAELQIGNPQKLELIAVAPGGKSEESSLHDSLEELSLSGEWFRDPGECLEHFWLLPNVAITVGGLAKHKPPLEALGRALTLDQTLLLYLSEALDTKQAKWCSCSTFYRDIKPNLTRDVGFGRYYAEDPWLKSSEAWDAVYLSTWACLPPCRPEICGGVY